MQEAAESEIDKVETAISVLSGDLSLIQLLLFPTHFKSPTMNSSI
jgi:hypothetical protein